MTAQELKQSIQASEGRVVLSENVVIRETLSETLPMLKLQKLSVQIWFYWIV